ncbi:hypothetical protein ACFWOJ_06965 [Streptomyces sp. NPDC058439]|uniref:hypothetical protein n=1 Tax=Streptomyces sp. NPDC058439 TaxID=3346500 RepID=UPI0036519745
MNRRAYNAGVAAGALLGGMLLPTLGTRGTFLVGGVLTAGAFAVLLVERTLPLTAAQDRAGVSDRVAGNSPAGHQ